MDNTRTLQYAAAFHGSSATKRREFSTSVMCVRDRFSGWPQAAGDCVLVLPGQCGTEFT